MRFAVVQSGGKQYIAQEGKTIEVDRLPLEVGRSVELREVLLAAEDGQVLVGAPLVEGASIQASVEAQVKGPKVRVFKYIPKERYRRRRGHRQQYTRLLVKSIVLPGGREARGEEVEAPAQAEGKPKAAARKAEAKPRAAARPAKKPAAKPAAKSAGGRKPATKKK